MFVNDSRKRGFGHVAIGAPEKRGSVFRLGRVMGRSSPLVFARRPKRMPGGATRFVLKLGNSTPLSGFEAWARPSER